MPEPLASDGSISALPERDRRRLLAAVVEPFATEGYRAASVERICRAGGIDRRLLGQSISRSP